MAEYFFLFLRLLLYMVPMGIFGFFALFVGLEIYIRRSVRGATLFVFWNPNREMVTKLVKTEDKQVVTLDSGTYTLHAEKQFSSGFPFWAPLWMQEKVPVYYFKPNEYEAIDPQNLRVERPL